jgi:hypothetical protein
MSDPVPSAGWREVYADLDVPVPTFDPREVSG